MHPSQPASPDLPILERRVLECARCNILPVGPEWTGQAVRSWFPARDISGLRRCATIRACRPIWWSKIWIRRIRTGCDRQLPAPHPAIRRARRLPIRQAATCPQSCSIRTYPGASGRIWSATRFGRPRMRAGLGLDNGDLLAAAERAGFEIMLTADRRIRYQQNLAGRRLALVVLSSPAWPIVQNHIPAIKAAVDAATPVSYQELDLPRPRCGVVQRRNRGHSGSARRRLRYPDTVRLYARQDGLPPLQGQQDRLLRVHARWGGSHRRPARSVPRLGLPAHLGKVVVPRCRRYGNDCERGGDRYGSARRPAGRSGGITVRGFRAGRMIVRDGEASTGRPLMATSACSMME